MNNKTIQKIIILSSIIFSFIFTATITSAYSCSGYSCDSYRYSPYNPYNQNDTYTTQYDYSQQVVPVPYVSTNTKPTVINNYYYQETPTSKNTTTTINKEVSSVDNNYTTDNQNTDDRYNQNNLGASAYNGYDESQGNEITALSLRGSGSFMPSSIWQWILVIILILAIIIIARMFVRKPHPADHDTHVAHAH